MSFDFTLLFRSFGFGDGKNSKDVFGDNPADSGVDSAGAASGRNRQSRKRTAMAMTNGDCGGASPILPERSAITRRRLEFE